MNDRKVVRPEDMEREAYQIANSLVSKFARMNADLYREYPDLLQQPFRPDYTQCVNDLAATLTTMLSKGLVIARPGAHNEKQQAAEAEAVVSSSASKELPASR